MKQKFNKFLREVDRPGVEDMIQYLETETDFYTAPASAAFHGACESGLLIHSLAVLKQVGKLAPLYVAEIEPVRESLIVAALLHDVCKANFYAIDYRNRKNEFGVWEKVPYYTIDDQLPLGHGEKSAYIVSRFIRLTDEEYAAIRWHMGAWGTTDYSGQQSLGAAMRRYPLVLLLQMADLAAAYFDQK